MAGGLGAVEEVAGDSIGVGTLEDFDRRVITSGPPEVSSYIFGKPDLGVDESKHGVSK